MQDQKPKNKGKAKLFSNRYVEFFTKAHPIFIFSIYLPLIGYLLFHSRNHYFFSVGKLMVLLMAGLFFWTLTEYLLHRFVFHYIPTSPTGKRISYLFHGNHHEFPRDKERLFMPPIPSIIISSVFLGSFYVLMQKNAFVFFAGFMLGYLIYGSMHYAIHAFNPPFKWMKGLWRNHELHHYKHADKGFGVSSTLWDHVFCTMYDLKQKKTEVAAEVGD